ncbi:MAG: hypothetical protein ACOYYU_06450 [Chloroflexota bacterium]
MNDIQNHNLDYLAARRAQELIGTLKKEGIKIKDAENSLTKALGVLQENGVYACFLYLLAREKEIGPTVIKQMRELLRDVGVQVTSRDNLEYAAELTADLPTLLLAKEALERFLTYARYGAKAAQKE